jgi:glycosyltransferase involved in cell wall biosynthesis
MGDIARWRGGRAYLLSFARAIRANTGGLDAFFLQQVGGARLDMAEEGLPLRILWAPGARRGAKIPRIAWKLYELTWALATALRLAIGHRSPRAICFVTGAVLLPLTPILRRLFRTIVYVQHGIAEELLIPHDRASRLRYAVTKTLEHGFLPLFDAITVVSTGMGEYCRTRYGIEQWHLLSCGADTKIFQYSSAERDRLRQMLGLEDRFVLVYCGAADDWRCLGEMVEFVRRSGWRLPRPFFLVLSADPQPLRAALRILDPQDYVVVNVPHHKVAGYLSAADAGVLFLRERGVLNQVCCPVKFAEYLACGLPVVISPGIGDCSSLVEARDVGVVVDTAKPSTWDDAVERLAALVGDPTTRSRCIGVAHDLSWDAAAMRLRAALAAGGTTQRAMVDRDQPCDNTPGLPTRPAGGARNASG